MFNALLLLFLPKRCAACYAILVRNELEICTNCRGELPLVNLTLNKPAYYTKMFGEVALENFSSLFYFEKHSETQELFHNLKYREHQHLGKILGEWHASILLQNNTYTAVNIVLPMPIHKKRLRQRGYNQVALYAKTIAKALSAEYRDDILLKTSHSKSQVFLNKKDRFHNILNGLTLHKPSAIQGKHVLILDDIITTGATMSACISCLLEVSCKISIASMALVRDESL